MERIPSKLTARFVLASVLAVAASPVLAADPAPRPSRNVVIFVADGLRNVAVNPADSPTLYNLRKKGVSFSNSHALFPTFTTPNAAAIATGHLLGDTGDFSNSVYVGFPAAPGDSVVPFIENDATLQDIDEHFPNGSLLDEDSLLAAARRAGLHTAAVGKLGPTLLQDVTQNNAGVAARTVIIDDATGSANGVKLPPEIEAALQAKGLALAAPARGENGDSGSATRRGTQIPNTEQQAFFVNALTQAILPAFVNDTANRKPFVVVYWSRDPDGSQHSQGDAFNVAKGWANQLGAGINGTTSKMAVRNADDNLSQIIEYLEETNDPARAGKKLIDNTDVFVTSDHGFGTISKHELSADGSELIDDYASTFTYHAMRNLAPAGAADWKPVEDTVHGFVPPGFLAIDLAHALGDLPMYDPEKGYADGPGSISYVPVDPKRLPEIESGKVTRLQHPVDGSAIIGGAGTVKYILDEKERKIGKLDSGARMIVAANGGSDLICLPNATVVNGKAADGDRRFLRQIVEFLTTQNYVSGLFADTGAYGKIPGALSLDDIFLDGTAQLPRPALVVNFRTFSTDPRSPLYTGVEVVDSALQEGQGMHGTFARFDTFNFMLAFGPDFKSLNVSGASGFEDTDPVSNADVAITLAHILGLELESKGTLIGRVLDEALVGGRGVRTAQSSTIQSDRTEKGIVTELHRQILRGPNGGIHVYLDSGGFPGRTVNP